MGFSYKELLPILQTYFNIYDMMAFNNSMFTFGYNSYFYYLLFTLLQSAPNFILCFQCPAGKQPHRLDLQNTCYI